MEISHDLGWSSLSVRVGFSAVMADRNARLTKDAGNSNQVAQTRKAQFHQLSDNASY